MESDGKQQQQEQKRSFSCWYLLFDIIDSFCCKNLLQSGLKDTQITTRQQPIQPRQQQQQQQYNNNRTTATTPQQHNNKNNKTIRITTTVTQ